MTPDDSSLVPPWDGRDDRRVAQLRAQAWTNPAVDPLSPRPSGRSWWQRAVAAGVTAGALCFVAFALWATQPDEGAGNLTVSALRSEPTADSRHIAHLLGSSSFAEAYGIDAAGLRQVSNGPNGAVFVAPAAQGWLCVSYSRSGGLDGTTCAPRSTLETEPILVESVSADGTGYAVAGVAADGYQRASYQARSVAILNNGILLTNLRGSGLLLVEGSDVPTQRAPVGRAPDSG